jgi:hypothetical protein
MTDGEQKGEDHRERKQKERKESDQRIGFVCLHMLCWNPPSPAQVELFVKTLTLRKICFYRDSKVGRRRRWHVRRRGMWRRWRRLGRDRSLA